MSLALLWYLRAFATKSLKQKVPLVAAMNLGEYPRQSTRVSSYEYILSPVGDYKQEDQRQERKMERGNRREKQRGESRIHRV